MPALRQADAGHGTRPCARPRLRDVLAPSAIRLPKADGALDEPDEPVAMGLAYTVDLSASDQSGESLGGKSAVWSCARWPSP